MRPLATVARAAALTLGLVALSGAQAFEGRALPGKQVGYLVLAGTTPPQPLARREGLAPREVHLSEDGALALVLWGPFGRGDLAVPELWSRTPQGAARVWPAGADLEWSEPRLRVRRRDRGLDVLVEDGLTGENLAPPLVRRRRLLRMTAAGVEEKKQALSAAAGPQQQLNLLALALEAGDAAGARDALEATRDAPLEVRRRAFVLVARATQGAARAQVERAATSLWNLTDPGTQARLELAGLVAGR